MFGPWALTHVVYVLLVIAFVAVETYMVVYNLKMKRREKALESGKRHLGTAEGIAAAAEDKHQQDLRRKH
ncbi:MAG TPA: hypothetical protein VIJ65_02975 [Acidobacteriaceae bacterium]